MRLTLPSYFSCQLSASPFSQLPDLPVSEISWPVYAAALNANGWKEKAQTEAQKLTASRLLPEERALIAPFVNGAPDKRP